MSPPLSQGVMALATFLVVCAMGFITMLAGGVAWGTSSCGGLTFVTFVAASVAAAVAYNHRY